MQARAAPRCWPSCTPILTVEHLIKAYGETPVLDDISFAVKPGDGSAREQAASCQRVLGAGANIVTEYATKRYRSNLINWGMLPLQLVGATPFGLGDYVFIPNVREALKGDLQDIKAYVLGDTAKEFSLYMAPLTADERKILADGCLINFYKH